MNMETTDCDLRTYIKKALENDSFEHCDITLKDGTDESDGYVSDINFASVIASTKQGVKKSFEVVVKTNNKTFDKQRSVLSEREVYFYETVLPEFTRFQIQNNIKNVFNSVPKYYKSISDENMIVIVMENLKESGYDLYNRTKPVDLDHARLVLREYGKFHAISFALRRKSNDNFEKLVSNYDDILLPAIISFFGKLYQRRMETVRDMLKQINETKLYEMFHKICQKGADVAMIELLEIAEPQSAILHGDCWINNFLFKYETEDHKNPSKVAILDWQLSRLHSPVLDLSYFIYSTCSEDQLKHFEELLDVYYTSFSTTLADFGCDSESLFPYSALQEHWKKYSLFGFIISTTFLHLFSCEKKEAPNESKDGHDFAEQVANVQIRDAPEYEKRLLAIVNHYYKYASTS